MDLVEGQPAQQTKGTQDKKNKRNVKIMVFFPTTRLVQLYSRFLTTRMGLGRVWELHGKMPQWDRTVAARRFRNAPQGVLLTSDVSARGVDYPDVTHVIQVGASPSRETYIHRLGRTGRAGKVGEGILILPEMEQEFLDDLDGLDIVCDEKLQQRLSKPRITNRRLQNELGLLQHDIRRGDDKEIEQSLHLAYHGMISYYFQTCRDRQQSSESVVSTANQLVQDFGLAELPGIDFSRAKSMGIESLPGLNIQKNWEDTNWNADGWIEANRKMMTDDEFQRKPYGDFDDWFGVARRPSKSDDGSKDNHQSPRQKEEGIPSSTRPKQTWSSKTNRKRKKSRFDNFPRWEQPGEFRQQ
jgi:superfamily II DNA/RNA helicase